VNTSTLTRFFAPSTIAVVGVSRSRGSIGSEIFHNLRDGGFVGEVFPINCGVDTLYGVRAYARVSDVPVPIDLAVVAVPNASVEAVVDDCLDAGVPAIVVITAGFGETGDEGQRRERALRERVRAAGARLIGPNCMGVLNADPAVRMNATFSPVFPRAGSVAFSSQSGALGLAVLEYADRLHLGLSNFASIGNKADLSSNDLLEWWEYDPGTSVVLLYLESFGNPRRFGEIARRVSRTKPIVAVKAGRSRSGARAASSHTGALAARDEIVSALFQDCGVIRTETLEELFDVAALLAHQPVPEGNRVAILTNAGGPGILAADACEALNLRVAPLTEATTRGLREFLPSAASVANPVDMLATAPADHYRRALPLLLADDSIDSVITIFIPPLVTAPEDVARAIADGARGSAKPVLANFFGAVGVPDLLAPVPSYLFPEGAARALAHAVAYGEWRRRPIGVPFVLDESAQTATRSIVGRASADSWLPSNEVIALLDVCGIPAAPTVTVTTVDQAIRTADMMGYPVVVKGSGPALIHKTEAHAVFRSLMDSSAVASAFTELARRADVRDIIVQRMAEGVEMMVGATRDASFGPVVLCGRGGTEVELLHDTTCRLAPITDLAAEEMLNGVRGRALLRGFRGSAPCDESAFRQIVLRISALAAACPAIAEIDLNPVIVSPGGATVVDARVKVAAASSPDCVLASAGSAQLP
jgi:acetyl coenzyme A synthetase (ADP forming)-like protein